MSAIIQNLLILIEVKSNIIFTHYFSSSPSLGDGESQGIKMDVSSTWDEQLLPKSPWCFSNFWWTQFTRRPFQTDSFGLSIYVERLSALQRAPKEKQNWEWRGQAALLSVFPGSIWKRREVWDSSHPGTKFSLSRMPGFLTVLWIRPHQTCFQFLIHVVTQCDGLFPRPSRNLILRIPGCPSIPLKSPVIHEASKRQNRGWGGGRQHCFQFSMSVWEGR